MRSPFAPVSPSITAHTMGAVELTRLLQDYPKQTLRRINAAFPRYTSLRAIGTHGDIACLFIELRFALSQGRTRTPRIYTCIAEGSSMSMLEDGVHYGYNADSDSPSLYMHACSEPYSEDL